MNNYDVKGVKMATNDELATDMVVNFLSGQDVYKIKFFKMDSVHLHPVLFLNLPSLILLGKIKVKFASGSFYYSGSDTLEFSFTTASSLTQKALIMHEATHAVLDVMTAPGMKIADSEAMAYIVQCQYARANNTVAGARLGASDTSTADGKAEDKVFKIAWTIAGKILKNKTPKNGDYQKLKKAISKAPKYRTTYNDTANWDGLQ